jgi:DNA repair ATPase RecN
LDISKPLPLQKEAMKITEVQEYKQINSTVDLDLNSIKTAINELDEMLRDEDFNADEVTECCSRIEGLATAISSGVINR